MDPRRTQTAKESDIHLPVVPGTDLLLLNAMAQVICEEKLHDDSFIRQHVRFSDGARTVAFDDFMRFLDDYRPERVAERLGVSAADIRRVAFRFARSPESRLGKTFILCSELTRILMSKSRLPLSAE